MKEFMIEAKFEREIELLRPSFTILDLKSTNKNRVPVNA
jgi:hypothetical protein